MGTLTGAFLQPAYGRLVDLLGARVCICSGLCAFAAAFFGFANAQTPVALYFCFALIRGLCLGGFEVWPNAAMNLWFGAKSRGSAFSVMLFFFCLWNGLASIPFSLAIEAYGWRQVYVGLSGIVLSLALPCLLFLVPRPQLIGLVASGEETGTGPDETGNAAEQVGAAAPLPVTEQQSFTVRQASRTWALWCICIMSMSMTCIGGGTDLYMAPEGSTRATACPSTQRSWSKHAAANAPSRPPPPDVPDPHVTPCPCARRLYAVPHPQPHHPYLFNIQDGRRNARCAALSTWGARTQPAVAAAWLELLI